MIPFWPFNSPTLFAVTAAKWLQRTPALARRLHRQDVVLERLATLPRIPKSPAGVSLARATAVHKTAVSNYRIVMAAVAQGYLDAVKAGKLKESDMKFVEIRREGIGSIGGGGWLIAVVIIAAAVGVMSVLQTYIRNRPSMLVAAATVDGQAKLIDEYLAHDAAWRRANPQARPDLIEPPAPSSPLAFFDDLKPIVMIGAGLWALSMLPKRGGG